MITCIEQRELMTLPNLQDWNPDPRRSRSKHTCPLEVQDMLLECDSLSDKLERIESAYNEQKQAPDTLFHYTDVYGMHGIAISNRELWLSDYRSTNDKTEGKYLRELLSHLYEKNVPNGLPDKLGLLINRKIASADEEFVEDWVASLRPRVFCSFSSLEDDTAQWLLYGDRGAGYCVGIKTNDLSDLEISLFNPLYKQFADKEFIVIPKLIKIVYDKNEQEKMCLEFLEQVFELFVKHYKILHVSPPALESLVNKVAGQINDFISKFSLCFKHPSFCSEKEWRLLIQLSDFDSVFLADHLVSRVSGSNVIWYFPVKCQIYSIRSGPMANYDRLRETVSIVNRQLRSHIYLYKSEAPIK